MKPIPLFRRKTKSKRRNQRAPQKEVRAASSKMGRRKRKMNEDYL
jgi:hypothetical protein